MLQQTQVATVLDYYARFLERFPDVRALAAAELDDVLALWSGLGYYSRARNLHRCAQRGGGSCTAANFRAAPQVLQTLPGIGRSTAAAIASFCFGERVAILDGNVKRVLTRVLGFGADLARGGQRARAVGRRRRRCCRAAALARIHAALHPGPDGPGRHRLPVAQADLPAVPGAPMCARRARKASPRTTRSRPASSSAARSRCGCCRRRRADGSVWLEKRPATGIWAGLYCLPVFDSRDALEAALPAPRAGAPAGRRAFVHVLTHKDLHLHPVVARLPARSPPAWARAPGSPEANGRSWDCPRRSAGCWQRER